MHFLRRSMIGVFLLAVTAGFLVLAGDLVWNALQTRWSDEPRQRPARERVFAASVVPVRIETVRPVLSTFGEVRARRRLELRAAAGGEVVWLSENFEEGGTVREGELLVRIDPAEADSERATARANVAEAEAELRDAENAVQLSEEDIEVAEEQLALRQRSLARQQDLFERGVGSAAAVEDAELAVSTARQALLSRRQAQANAEARLDQARISLDRARIALAEAERRLRSTEIRAGFSGVLAEVDAVVGDLLSPGERLAELIDTTSLEVTFRVSTLQYAGLLSETGQLAGAEVTASVDILGVDIEARGRISRESAVVGEGQTGRLLFASLETAPGFRPGDFVAVRIVEPPLENVARLPAAALDAAGTVLVLTDEERLESAAVELLRREGDDVIVRAPHLDGREVVAARTPLLGDGIRVRPVRPETPARAEETEMLSLDPERRARLVAFVENSAFMPEDVKTRVLAQLRAERVPARVVERIEARMGG